MIFCSQLTVKLLVALTTRSQRVPVKHEQGLERRRRDVGKRLHSEHGRVRKLKLDRLKNCPLLGGKIVLKRGDEAKEDESQAWEPAQSRIGRWMKLRMPVRLSILGGRKRPFAGFRRN